LNWFFSSLITSTFILRAIFNSIDQFLVAHPHAIQLENAHQIRVDFFTHWKPAMNRIPAADRRGFTLIELLVVIAILLVLIGILLPALTRVRESANRAKCSHNLHQIGLAMGNYNTIAGKFPASSYSSPARSWIPDMLNLIEADNIFKMFHFDKAWDHSSNHPAIASPIRVMQCPSVPKGDGRFDTGTTSGVAWKASVADYGPVTGVIKTGAKGIMQANLQRPLEEITDGFSNTILLGEDAGRPKRYVRGNKLASGSVSGAGWADDECNLPLHGFSIDGSTSGGPCAVNCTNDNELYGFHHIGAMVLMADGSVKLLRQEIDINIVAAYITFNGKDATPPLP